MSYDLRSQNTHCVRILLFGARGERSSTTRRPDDQVIAPALRSRHSNTLFLECGPHCRIAFAKQLRLEIELGHLRNKPTVSGHLALCMFA